MFYATTLAMLSILILVFSSSSAILTQQATAATTGRFIVTLHTDYSHEHFEHFMTKPTKPQLPTHDTADVKETMMEVHHRYSKTFHGLAVSGVTEEQIRKHPE
jgi:uncharacterized protein YpuA (DUF1002 family)